MVTCSRTGIECAHLTVATAFNERSYAARKDGSIDLEMEEERMRKFSEILEIGQKNCNREECGVLSYAAALAIATTIAVSRGSSLQLPGENG